MKGNVHPAKRAIHAVSRGGLLLLVLLGVITLVARETRAEDLDRAAAEGSGNTVNPVILAAQLADESFLVREKAMEEIWRLGVEALPTLHQVVAGGDPEAADRARELILYISAGVLFDSPEEVKALVLGFFKSTSDDKVVIIKKLMQLKQWKQVLYLTKLEKDPKFRSSTSRLIAQVASIALRQAIVNGDARLAEEIMGLLGDDHRSMLIRAWIYCHHGKLEQELEKAAGITGKNGNLWRMSLHRASGNISAAINEAQKAGEHELADAWRVLEGDALPWLVNNNPKQGRDAIYKLGCAIQVSRLQGKDREAQSAVDALLKLADDPFSATRVMNSLAVNGYRDESLELLRKHHVNAAFDYYDSIEMPELSLEMLGIAKDAKPPYLNWVRKFTDKAIEEEEKNLYDTLIMLAGFLAERGEREHAIPVLEPMMSALEEDGADVWFSLLDDMQAVGLGAEAIHFIKERGNEDGEADMGVRYLLGQMEVESRDQIWGALKKRNQDELAKALDELALLAGLVADPDDDAARLHQTLLDETPPGRRPALMKALYEFCENRNDFALASSIADQMALENESWLEQKNHLDESLLRWEEIEPVYAQKAQSNRHDFHNLIKWYMALRKLGRDQEATEAYKQAMLLSIGKSSILNYWGLLLNAAGFEKEAAGLWTHAALLAHVEDPKDTGYDYAMYYLAANSLPLYRNNEWKRAAAVSEVVLRIHMGGVSNQIDMRSLFTARHRTELCRGMQLLRAGNKVAGIKKLDMARRLIPGDGLLADDFFPLIREEKLGKVYDQWFEESYHHIEAACELYPDSHNSHNTAAWLAARAVRKLDGAHAHAVSALKARPKQGPYLDTMAEVWFARGEREKALEWSRKAIASSISGAHGKPRSRRYVFSNVEQLTKQYEHFKNDPLPNGAR